MQNQKKVTLTEDFINELNDYDLNEKIVIFGDSFASSDGDFNFKENEIEHNNKAGMVYICRTSSYTKANLELWEQKKVELVYNIQNNNYSVI